MKHSFPKSFLLIRQYQPGLKPLDETFVLRCREILKTTTADVRRIFYGNGFTIIDWKQPYARKLERLLKETEYPHAWCNDKAVQPTRIKRADLRLKDNILTIEKGNGRFSIDLEKTPSTITTDNGYDFLSGSVDEMINVRHILVMTNSRAYIIDMIHLDFVDVIDGPSHDEVIHFFRNVLRQTAASQATATPAMHASKKELEKFATILQVAHVNNLASSRIPLSLMQPDDRTTLSESYADSELKRLQKREGFWSNLFEGMMTPVPIDASAFRMLAKVFINGLWAGGILFYLFRTWFPLIVFLSIVLTFQLVRIFRLTQIRRKLSGAYMFTVRSAAVGPVKLHGKTVADDPLFTLFSNEPCLATRTRTDLYRENGDAGEWLTLSVSESTATNGWLDDGTGIIRIQMKNATIQYPVGNTYNQDGTPWDHSTLPRNGDIRIHEQFIADGSSLFAMGFAQPCSRSREHKEWISRMLHDSSNMELFDFNKDGTIDEAETATARNQLYSHRLESGHYKGQAGLLVVDKHKSFPHLTVSHEAEWTFSNDLMNRVHLYWTGCALTIMLLSVIVLLMKFL